MGLDQEVRTLTTEIVRPVNLKQKRVKAGHSQEELAQILGVRSERISRYESGRFNLPTPQACKAALLYDGITLEFQGVKFQLIPQHGHEVKAPEKITPAECALIADKEMRDFLEKTKLLAEYALATMQDGDFSTRYLVDAVKEAQEAKDAAERFILKVKSVDPETYRQGMALAKKPNEDAKAS